MIYRPKESPKKILRRQRDGRWVARFLRVLGWTLRYRLEDPYKVLAETKPRIWAVWHNRLAVTPLWYGRIRKKLGPLSALISASGDGEFLAAIMAEYKMQAVRGSKSRGGEEALRALLKELEKGRSVTITPDGPRGPCYYLQPGVIKLAEWSKIEIVPLQFEISHKLELKSWDKFQVPFPFAKCIMRIERPFHVKEGDLESYQNKLTKLLGV